MAICATYAAQVALGSGCPSAFAPVPLDAPNHAGAPQDARTERAHAPSGTTQPAIAMKWTAAAGGTRGWKSPSKPDAAAPGVTRVWRTSWNPNVAGHGSGRLRA